MTKLQPCTGERLKYAERGTSSIQAEGTWPSARSRSATLSASGRRWPSQRSTSGVRATMQCSRSAISAVQPGGSRCSTRMACSAPGVKATATL
jgi:hypothetical protein